jgi:hypothetical protein
VVEADPTPGDGAGGVDKADRHHEEYEPVGDEKFGCHDLARGDAAGEQQFVGAVGPLPGEDPHGDGGNRQQEGQPQLLHDGKENRVAQVDVVGNRIGIEAPHVAARIKEELLVVEAKVFEEENRREHGDRGEHRVGDGRGEEHRALLADEGEKRRHEPAPPDSGGPLPELVWTEPL